MLVQVRAKNYWDSFEADVTDDIRYNINIADDTRYWCERHRGVDVAKYENRRDFWDEDTEDSETHRKDLTWSEL